jgi:hypothetical protein
MRQHNVNAFLRDAVATGIGRLGTLGILSLENLHAHVDNLDLAFVIHL